MKNIKYILTTLMLVLSCGLYAQYDTTKTKSVIFTPYLTVKENVYNRETTNRFQLNPTLGVAAHYKSFDFKLFYGTTISTFDNYGKQLNASVGGVTLTYNCDDIIKKQIILPYATCRINVYNTSVLGLNPALGLALNYNKFSFRLFDGLNFRNNKFTDKPNSTGTANVYGLTAATVCGVSVTYNFVNFIFHKCKRID